MFFGATLRFIILVDDGRPRRRNQYNDAVYVLNAANRAAAFRAALRLGRDAEVTYANKYGQSVRWAFVEVVSLDEVGSRVAGREVASRFHTMVSGRPIQASARFRPATSDPARTI